MNLSRHELSWANEKDTPIQ